MGYYNVPDDWGMYYYPCGCHASEGGCSCPGGLLEDAERPWLEESGYELEEGMTWNKLISLSVHTCRRDHKDGKIKKGQRYKVKVYRYIEDESGASFLHKQKTLMKKRAVPK